APRARRQRAHSIRQRAAARQSEPGKLPAEDFRQRRPRGHRPLGRVHSRALISVDMKRLILPMILLPALLIAMPVGEAQTQNGYNAQQDRSGNRRVAGAGDYQIALEVSGRVEVSRFFKMPDPLDLRSICDAKREAERRAILSSESYLNTLSQAGDRRQFE